MPALYDQILCFGDSITQNSFNPGRGFGFSPALQTAYIRKLDVVNRGQSGYNTRQALKVLPVVIPSPEEARIRFLVVFFGANDAALKSVSPQHVPIDEYTQNLETIVKDPLVQAHNPRIILVTPPPINEHLWWPNDREKGFASVSRIAATTKSYADAVCELGQKLNVPVVNLWKAIMIKTNFQIDTWKVGGEAIPGSLEAPLNDELVRLMYDGLHLDIAGYDILYEELMKVIAQTWPDQLPDSLPMVLPEWKDEEAWKAWEAARAGKQPNGQGV